MRFIRKKEIKFIKLLLISPYFDQLIHLFYLISLGILYVKFLNIPGAFTNYDIGKQISLAYEEEFRMIKNIEDFKYYINRTVYKLNDLSRFPMFIPIGGFRLKKYSIVDDCFMLPVECSNKKSSM